MAKIDQYFTFSRLKSTRAWRCWRCWLLSPMSTFAPTLGFTNFAAQNITMDNGHAVWLLFWKNALGRAFLVPAGFQGFSHELHLVRSRDCPHTNMLGHRQHHHPQPLAKMLNHGHQHRHYHPQPHDNMINWTCFHELSCGLDLTWPN